VALPFTAVAPVGQVLVLLLVATLFIRRFRRHCSSNRRGALLMGALLGAAGLLKVAVLA
jgi:hypothetical protein